ncbi:hypothetical protein ES705_28185 [subsurface metagenome]
MPASTERYLPERINSFIPARMTPVARLNDEVGQGRAVQQAGRNGLLLLFLSR